MALKYIPFRLVFFCCTNLVTEVQKRAKLHLDSMYSLQIKIYIVESGNKLSLSFHCILTTHSNQKRTLIKNKNMLNFKTKTSWDINLLFCYLCAVIAFVWMNMKRKKICMGRMPTRKFQKLCYFDNHVPKNADISFIFPCSDDFNPVSIIIKQQTKLQFEAQKEST